ncbi:MAG: peptide-methionine (R)-S-oxide reductase MsrB [Alphaproteobacteria bacterium]|nr:peptide-methionine (R)-S-oxide reductase MsrB [Alphaproteobacteria bacterium]
MHRRHMLKLTGTVLGIAALPGLIRATPAWAETVTPITRTDEEWKKMLTPEQYDVLRCEGTERPFTSPLLNEHRKGVFACAGCGLELFNSDTKYDSGTGWPSFFAAIPDHVGTKADHKLLMERTEYHCARCGGHQGHIFPDGPKPTGLRYCNNGVALKFVPKEG